jgi:hypothetical protein
MLVVSAILKCSGEELCLPPHSYWWEKCLKQGFKNYPKTGSHLKILGAMGVKYSKFHIEKSHTHILGTIIKKLVAWVT